MFRPLTTLAFLLASVTLCAAAPTGPTTASQVASLLKAGVGEAVILKYVAANPANAAHGGRLSLTADEIVMLKEAGASDRLLAALVGPADTAERPAFRVYREKNDRGEEVLVVTNLDESGRRIGGEIAPDDAPPGGPREADRRQPEGGQPFGEDRVAEPQAPVIVNIYPPEPTGFIEPPDGYRSDRIMAGGYWLGGYPAGGFGGPPRHPRDRGFDRMPVEPGLFGMPRPVNTLPYRHGTAAQRNREAFRRH